MSFTISQLGFDEGFLDQIQNDPGEFEPARIISVHKESCIATNGVWQSRAEVTGKIMFSADSPLDYPTVGDWCLVQYFGDSSNAIIHEILPRKSLLKRKTSGKRIEFQAIASNIETAFIVQAVDDDFNLRRLERYLVMTRDGKIEPVILLSKSDLVQPAELEQKTRAIRDLIPDIGIIPFSSVNSSGFDSLEAAMSEGKTFCLLGSSGVGKTTMLNKLLGEELFKTQNIREKDGKGRHTTTDRQLIVLKNGAMIIDTPGMRELGNIGADSGIETIFEEIAGLENQCKFRSCSHNGETGCAIIAAIENEEITAERFDAYRKLKNESAHYEMSYHEKRKKAKKLGKLYKSIQKHNAKK